MKMKNVKFTAIVYSTVIPQTLRWFCTEQAMSKWANAQYRKDENCTVEVYEGNSIFGKKYCTYHA